MKINVKNLIFCISLAFSLIGNNSNILGQVWNKEAVDSTGIDNGAFCSLEIDGNNQPHIAFMDADYYDLKYALKSDENWEVLRIDSLRYSGISSDLAIDSENQVHICFQEGCEFIAPCPDAGLKYMTKTSEGWIKETVDEFFVFTGATDQTYCSIQLSSDNQPYIAYYKVGEDAVKLAYKEESEWIKKEYPLNNPPTVLSLVLKSDNTPIIQYVVNDSLHVVSFDINTDLWEHFGTPVVPYLWLFQGGYNFDIDKEDNLHFVFPSLENAQAHYKYIRFNWQDWTKEILPEGGPFFIKVNEDNIPYAINLMDSNGLSLCKREGDGWISEEIDENVSSTFASLDFDNSNNPHIALYGRVPELSDDKTASLFYYHFCSGLPIIEISSSNINFENVWIQSYADKIISIRNKGVAPLVIENLKFDPASVFQFINTNETVMIQAADSLELTIRFTPELEQAYSEQLELITNDQNYPLININFIGNGVSDDTTANLNLSVNDVFADMDYLIINKETPLSDVKVELFQSSLSVTGSLFTDNEGLAHFENLSPGIYEIRISKMLSLYQQESLLASKETIEIGPGINSHSMILPDSLYQYKYQLMEVLNKIEESEYLLTNEFFSYEEIESEVDLQLRAWAADYDPQRTESIARLILVEAMVKDLYNEGTYVSNEMFADFGDLIGFIFYADDWGMSIIEFLKLLVKNCFEGGAASAAKDLFTELLEILKNELIKRAILESITEAVELVGSELPHPGDIIINEAWKEVKSDYSSMPNLSFGNVAWDEIRSEVKLILMGPFIQEVYIELLTSPTIEKALDYSISNESNGNFTTAFRQEIDFVSDQKNEVETRIKAAAFLRQTANLFMVSANILDYAAALDPTGVLAFAQNASSYLRISAYIEVITALGISTGEFFTLPNNMEDAVDDIYFPESELKNAIYSKDSDYKKSKYGTFNQENLTKSLLAEENSYDSILLVIKDKILSGDGQNAALELFTLKDIDNTYSNQIKQTYAPLSAVATEASRSLSAFTPMYDSLISYKGKADEEKIITYLKVFCVAFDSTGQLTDSVLSQIDKTIQTNHKLTSHISEMLEVVSATIELPGVIVASMLKQDKNTLAIGEEAKISLKIRNVGAVKTENISFKVESNEALSYTGPDSIIVGNLEPGQESEEFSVVLSLTNKDFKIALWDIIIECDDAVAYSPSGSFEIKETSTEIEEKIINKKPEFYCSPNPVSATGIIFYDISTPGNLKIDLYDISGRKIMTLLNDFQEVGHSYFPWNASSLANGIYCIKIQEENQPLRTIKVLVNK